MVFATDLSLARTVPALSFPPRGVTGTSGYCFEYNLHLIKIPSHLNRESIYILMETTCLYSNTSGDSDITSQLIYSRLRALTHVKVWLHSPVQ